MADQGPAGLSENCPWGELDASVTVIGVVASCGVPIADTSVRVRGPEGTPAVTVCGCVPNASTACDHVRNDFHCSVNWAPAKSPTQ